MSYSVRQLAKMSGVSVRTLHWYDEIDLLKPAYYGANGYRHYEEEQLLLLQQILFFRELGFKLDEIRKVLTSNDFDKIRALYAHKHVLEEGLDSTRKLVETINQTILRLRGKKDMEDKELYKGFDLAKQKGSEKYLVKYHGTIAEELIGEASKDSKELNDKERLRIEREVNLIYKAVAACIDKGLVPRSDEVQTLVEKHYQMTARVHSVNKDVYTAYAQLYCERPEFRKFLDPHHPQLAEFLAEAMRVYAHHRLS